MRFFWSANLMYVFTSYMIYKIRHSNTFTTNWFLQDPESRINSLSFVSALVLQLINNTQMVTKPLSNIVFNRGLCTVQYG